MEVVDLGRELGVFKFVSMSKNYYWVMSNILGRVCKVAADFFCSSSRKSLGIKRS